MARERLTGKQAEFCKQYIIDLNATQAAIRAGYSPRSAMQIGELNMRKHDIQAEIKRLNGERSQRTEITADYVLQKIQTIVERASDETNADGYNENAALKGLELLGKHLALWTDKTQLSGADGGPLVVQIVRFGEQEKSPE